jgi:nicotinamide-nucleotide adenylyltransferase
VHGRFQILHLDHLRHILSARPLCRHLVVGITNPDPVLTRHEPAEPQRSRPDSNPLTFFERFRMLREALEEAGVPVRDFSVVPFPVSHPDLYHCYVPMDALFFVSIYNDWGREKLRRFEALGLKTHVLRRVASEEKGISAEDVRHRIIGGEPWEHLVPPAVARLLRQLHIIERLTTQTGG